MSYSTVLFDLDGTLLNTLADLRASMNRALAGFSFPPHTLEEVRSFVGNGIRDYTSRAVPAGTGDEIKERVLAAFKKDYAEHCMDDTVPYDGILPLLCELKARGVKTAIVSNKADFAVQKLAQRYFDGLVTLSRGELPDVPKKPAPDMLYAVIDALGATKETTLFVGDSDTDCLTAKNAGLDVVLVDWGFRDRALLCALAEAYPAPLHASVLSSVEALKSAILGA